MLFIYCRKEAKWCLWKGGNLPHNKLLVESGGSMVIRSVIGVYNQYETEKNEDEITVLSKKTEENNSKILRYAILAFIVNLFFYFI